MKDRGWSKDAVIGQSLWVVEEREYVEILR